MQPDAWITETMALIEQAFPRQSRLWRLRRRVAFFVGLRLHMPALGYLIDVDRDRHQPR